MKLADFYQFKKNFLIPHSREFDWADINFTLHGCLSHSADLIALNNGYGLGELSEEALESNNKFIRNYASSRARKTSPDEQCFDVMARLLERSCPFQQELKKQFHATKRNSRKAVMKDNEPVRYEIDCIVNSIIISD